MFAKCSEVALMSPGLQGLHRHGSYRRQALLCLQPGGAGVGTPGGPERDQERNSGGGYGPGEISEVRLPWPTAVY